jgi:DNA-binding SARP family transcriptional activator
MSAVATTVGNASTDRDGSETPAHRFRLALLNGFELTRGGDPIPLSSGSQHLLAYLAVNDRLIRRAHIAGMLWADVSDVRAAGNLRSALWRLRMAGLDLVGAHGNCLRLSALVTVDIREASRLIKVVQDPAADPSVICLEEFAFGAELLPGWYQDWVVLERERQRQICLHLLESLCETWTRAGHYEKAVMAGLAAVASEPLRESAHRALIGAHLAEGNLAEAARQYEIYRTVLFEELRLEPSAGLTSLLQGYDLQGIQRSGPDSGASPLH